MKTLAFFFFSAILNGLGTAYGADNSPTEGQNGKATWGNVAQVQKEFAQQKKGKTSTVTVWSPQKKGTFDTLQTILDYKAFGMMNSRSRTSLPTFHTPAIMTAPSLRQQGKASGFGLSLVPGSGVTDPSTNGHLYFSNFSAPTTGLSMTIYCKLLTTPPAAPPPDGSTVSPYKQGDKLYACFTLNGIAKNNPGEITPLGKKYIQIYPTTAAPEYITGMHGISFSDNTSPAGATYMQCAFSGDDPLEACEIVYELCYDLSNTGFDDFGEFNGTPYPTPLLFSCFAGGNVQQQIQTTVDGIADDVMMAIGQSPLRLGAVFTSTLENRTSRANEISGKALMSLVATPQNNSYLLASAFKDYFVFNTQPTQHKAMFANAAMNAMARTSSIASVMNHDHTNADDAYRKQGGGDDTPESSSPQTKSVHTWVQPFVLQRASGTIRAQMSGALVGAHYSCDPKWGVGCALGWARNLISEGKESDVNNGINATLPVVAPYGYYHAPRGKRHWSAFQSFIISNGAMKTSRYISAPALNGSVLKGKILTNIVISNTYIGCRIEQANQVFYTPYGALAIVWDKFGAFSEHAPTDLDQSHSELAAELLLSPGAHNTTYAAPELGVRIAKQSSEFILGIAEYFLSLAGTYLYSPSNSYGMNYVNNPSPYTLTIGSASALYGSVALGAQITTYSQWSWGLMGRIDFSRLDTIYRAILFVKKKFK